MAGNTKSNWDLFFSLWPRRKLRGNSLWAVYSKCLVTLLCQPIGSLSDFYSYPFLFKSVQDTLELSGAAMKAESCSLHTFEHTVPAPKAQIKESSLGKGAGGGIQGGDSLHLSCQAPADHLQKKGIVQQGLSVLANGET